MVGNLTRDPEYKQLQSGIAVCTLGLASNRQYKNKQTGNMIQEVCFIDVDVFGKQAESCRQFLQKGRPVLIEGRIKFDSWESQGQKRSKHSVIADRVLFLGGNSAQETDAETTESFAETEPKEFSAAFDGLKASKKTKKVAKDEESDLEFKDEPPFQDDLPF